MAFRCRRFCDGLRWCWIALGPATKICLTGLPIGAVANLGLRRFHFYRRLFFPKCRLSLEDAKQHAFSCTTRWNQSPRSRQLSWIELREGWYGIDPIHIQLRHWSRAWAEVLSKWNGGEASKAAAHASVMRWIYLRTRRPNERVWLGIQAVSPSNLQQYCAMGQRSRFIDPRRGRCERARACICVASLTIFV